MILGLSLSHDSSAALVSKEGSVHSALAEERISRKKNHIGLPVASITELLKSCDEPITNVVIGSHDLLDHHYVDRLLSGLDKNPSVPSGTGLNPWPGYNKRANRFDNPKIVLEARIRSLISEISGRENLRFDWINHHDSHLGCALGAAENSDSLLLSLDGSGDGESGAIARLRSSSGNLQFENLARIPAVDSLGNLYTAITRKYNFKPSQHEGKITGLAAFGSYSAAVDVLLEFVGVENGLPKIRYTPGLKGKVFKVLSRKLGVRRKLLSSMDEIVSLAEENTSNYEDLAFAIQYVLEKSVLEIVTHWLEKTDLRNVSLAGGVFANVKLNQKISELKHVDTMNVFPNMGDGGIAIGGTWSYLSRLNELKSSALGSFYSSMYLAPIQDATPDIPERFDFTPLDNNSLAIDAAKKLSEGFICAVHLDSMEFGPRALGNRSILIDPRKANVNQTVNKRLKRTEFMPFAPIVLENYFDQYFESQNVSKQPFYYMTSTCMVRPEYRSTIPAVTHVDGTARPQIVTKESNTIVTQILEEFCLLTGVPVLVNTSFNVHEEPINFQLKDSLEALERNAVDIIYTNHGKITLRNTSA